MKVNLKLVIVAAVLLLSVFAFKPLYEAKNNTGEVNRVSGVYIFVDCSPVKDYESLGTVKCPIITNSKDYEDLMPKMVKIAKKEYKDVEAVIFNPGSIYTAEAIKFK